MMHANHSHRAGPTSASLLRVLAATLMLGSTTGFAATVEFGEFESKLQKELPGSYVLYSKLDNSSRQEVFRTYQEIENPGKQAPAGGGHAGMDMAGGYMKMAPTASDTHHFEVKFEDKNLTGKRGVKLIGAKVMVTVTNDRTGEKVVSPLHEMYGGSGYHYGSNIALATSRNKSTDTYTVKTHVKPPSFARSNSTRDVWSKDTVVEFKGVTMHVPKDVHDVHIGKKTAGNMVIDVEAEHAESMWMMDHGKAMDHMGKEHTHHLVVKVFVDPALASKGIRVERTSEKVPMTQVSLTLRDSKGKMVGKPLDLHTMHSKGGFHYGGNFGLPGPGKYTAVIKASPPDFVRSTKQKDKWLKPIEQTFDYTWDGTPMGEEIEIGAVKGPHNTKIEFEAEHPELMWMAGGGGGHAGMDMSSGSGGGHAGMDMSSGGGGHAGHLSRGDKYAPIRDAILTLLKGGKLRPASQQTATAPAAAGGHGDGHGGGSSSGGGGHGH